MHSIHEYKKQTTIDFSLADQVYAHAKVSNVDSVGLWLGAGVMVEYSLDEAKELLVRWLPTALFLNSFFPEGIYHHYRSIDVCIVFFAGKTTEFVS